MLADRGIKTIPQFPIGRYNCDLATDSIAVEVWGGHWHWHGAHLARTEERFRYIMNRRWNILVVCIQKSFPLTAAVGDYVASYIKTLSSSPPNICEYRVIWGAGEFSTGGRADDDYFSVKPPFTRAHNLTTGRYMRIPC